jgi:GT2 family glycosyltransferase/MoaA/NifB/PqqE/SkfB family radical SAM enzyme
MKLSIIIISNNRINDLRRCLNSIFRQDYKDYEVIVFNNGSQVPGYSEIKKEFSEIIYLENKINLGASIARNEAAKKSRSEYILFLDDDAQLIEKNTLKKAITIIENDISIGQLGGVQQNNKGEIQTYGAISGWDGFLDRKKSSLSFNGQLRAKGLHIPTSFCLMNTKLFFDVGGFDPIYYFYDEDVDLSLRVTNKGYDCVVAREIIYKHQSGSSIRTRNRRYFNKSYLIFKNSSLIKNILYLIVTFLNIFNFRSLNTLDDNLLKFRISFDLFLNLKLISNRRNKIFLNDNEIIENNQILSKLNYFEAKDFKESKNNNKTAFIFITNRCQAKCQHCFYIDELNKAIQDELSLEEYKKLAKNLDKEIKQVIITGGEPFLRKDIFGISKAFLDIKHLKSLNFITNGLLTKRVLEDTEKLLKSTSRNKRFVINISLDGLEAQHDKIRGIPGMFKKCMATIEGLKKLREKFPNLEVSGLTTVTKDNLDRVKDLNEYVENHLDIYHRINIIRGPKTGVFGVNRNIVEESFNPDWVKPFHLMELTKEQHKEIIDHFNQKEGWRDYHKMILYYGYYIKQHKKKLFTCSAPNDNIVIYPNGDFTFCEYTKTFDNVRNHESFLDIWNSEKANKRRKELIGCACDHPCNLGGNLEKNYELQNILPPIRSN